MALKRLDAVQQYATGLGTGNLTLGSAVSGRVRTLQAAGMSDGDTARVRIDHATIEAEWEIVTITLNSGVISRTFDSDAESSTGALIDFSAGDKIVSAVVIKSEIVPGLPVDENGDATAPRDLTATRALIAKALTLTVAAASSLTFNVSPAGAVQNGLISQEELYQYSGHADGSADARVKRSRVLAQGANSITKQYDQYLGMEGYTTAGTIGLSYGVHQYTWNHRQGTIARVDQNYSHARISGDDVTQSVPSLRATGNITRYNAYTAGSTIFDLTPGSTDTGIVDTVVGFFTEALGSQILRVNTVRAMWLSDTVAATEVSGIYSELIKGGANPTLGKWFIRHVGGAPSYHFGEWQIDRQNGGGTTERALYMKNLGTNINNGLYISFDLGGADNSRDARIQALNPLGGGHFTDLEFYVVNGASPQRALKLDHTRTAVFDAGATFAAAVTMANVTGSTAFTAAVSAGTTVTAGTGFLSSAGTSILTNASSGASTVPLQFNNTSTAINTGVILSLAPSANNTRDAQIASVNTVGGGHFHNLVFRTVNAAAPADVLTLGVDKTATFTGKAITPATTTGAAGLNIPHGTAPTSPVNGDMWTTTAGAFIRINGVTKTFTLT